MTSSNTTTSQSATRRLGTGRELVVFGNGSDRTQVCHTDPCPALVAVYWLPGHEVHRKVLRVSVWQTREQAETAIPSRGGVRLTKKRTCAPHSRRRTARRTFTPIEYILGKGTSRLLNARVDSDEIRLLVNGPTMLYGSCRLLTSLDAAEGATFQAWNTLAAALTCTSHCGLNGKTDIPVVVLPSRIGTCLEFGTGPMSMYLATVVLRIRRRGVTFRQVIDDAFGNPRRTYQARHRARAGHQSSRT